MNNIRDGSVSSLPTAFHNQILTDCRNALSYSAMISHKLHLTSLAVQFCVVKYSVVKCSAEHLVEEDYLGFESRSQDGIIRFKRE